MPGPFPGMDPYLENPECWRGVHHRLITFAAEYLQERLPPTFIADIDERMYLVQQERSLYPDVMVSRLNPQSQNQRPGGGAAILETTLEPQDIPGVLITHPVEMAEGFIEIRTGTDWNTVVTVIEVLSPANKASGSVGRREYLQKQRELMRTETNLLEIDLLRRGRHAVAAPLHDLQQLGTWNYLFSLHRSATPHQYEYWMNRLPQRLPRVRVPLTEEYPDVLLDLQAVFNRVYDSGPYGQRTDYAHEPIPPLTDEEEIWANALLREKGIRS